MPVEDIIGKKKKIALIGLGYVGLPIALAFAKKASVIGFDINSSRIDLLKRGIDPSKQLVKADFDTNYNLDYSIEYKQKFYTCCSNLHCKLFLTNPDNYTKEQINNILPKDLPFIINSINGENILNETYFLRAFPITNSYYYGIRNKLQFLLENVNFNLNTRFYQGNTILHYITLTLDYELITRCERFSDASIKNEKGEPAYDWIIKSPIYEKRHVHEIQKLLKKRY